MILSADNYSQSATPVQLVLLSVSELSLQIQCLFEVARMFDFFHHFVVIKKTVWKVVCASSITEITNHNCLNMCYLQIKTVEEF
jgi:hypothetical protein